LSPGKIAHPKPSKPYASRQLREADYETSPIDDLEDRFAMTRISDRHGKYSSSPSELSDDSTSSGTAFSRSSPSSLSSMSDRSCKCERYGVTRSGQRVKLDCGGKRCGYNSSDCSSSDNSEESDESSEDERLRDRDRKVRVDTARSGGNSERRGTAYVVERRPRR